MRICVDISDGDVAILEFDIADIREWLVGMVQNQIAVTKHSLARRSADALLADPAVKTMPADEDGLIAAFQKRKDYRTAKQRNEEAAATLPPAPPAEDAEGKEAR